MAVQKRGRDRPEPISLGRQRVQDFRERLPLVLGSVSVLGSTSLTTKSARSQVEGVALRRFFDGSTALLRDAEG